MKRILYTISFLAFGFTSFAQDSTATKEYEPVKGKLSGNRKGTFSYTATEQMPEFPGGTAALIEYLSTNIKYPAAAKESAVQGRVIVRFVVCKDGSLCDEQVMKPIGGGCDEEVIRVVKAMPKWKPGMQNGEPIKVYYTLPVSFKLPDPKPKESEETK